MQKLRWGVIGAGGIADRRTIPGMMLCKNAELIAVVDYCASKGVKIAAGFMVPFGFCV